MVTVGQFKAPFGVHGWLKLASFTDPQENILDYRPWYIEDRTGGWVELETDTVKKHAGGYVVQLSGVEDRDQAATLRGKRIAVRRQCLPVAKEGEYYWSDLIGLDVYDDHNKLLGRVKDMMETGANDVLVVLPSADNRDNKGQAELLIPFVPHVVGEVDLEQGRLTVNWKLDY